ncbi:hypothetical protein [Shinella sp.]|uniref:hypothetical protein n=1 Tax=Shinella sp. TaxID=1870904 RepID=UPI0029B3C780|nr:hypothetical protein [Shinella sp.]MDX3976311.1 hypothetical protein [Shinella sp.]
MSNVLAFPTAQLFTEAPGSALDAGQLHAYAKRHPDRIADMSAKLRLAAKAAVILHALMDDINVEIRS